MSGADTTTPQVVLEHQAVVVYQLRTPELGDSTYIVASGEEAAVVDAQRDVERGEAALDSLGVRVVAVLETHVHNDYVTGGPELARRRSASYVVPRDSGYEGGRTVFEGDEIEVGRIRLRPLFTPGHTPHHLSYEIALGAEVLGVLSGGSVLVGAVGRSDLISPDLTESLTRQQYRSAAKIGELPEPTVIGPTHGAGSFCTSSPASDETSTTVGNEKERNPAFLIRDEDEFVHRQLAGLGPYPAYYAQMGAINRSGSKPWPDCPLRELAPERLPGLMGKGVVLVDTRPRLEFAKEHVQGAVNVELDGPFSAYLGWIFPWGTRFVLMASSEQEAQEAARQAARIGIDSVEGWVRSAGWKDAGLVAASYRSVEMENLKAELSRPGDRRVLDVRQDSEWSAGHIIAAARVPIQNVRAKAQELAAEPGTTYVHCASGYRAAIATSLLQASGGDVVHVNGGFGTGPTRIPQPTH
ncbi:MAG: rhodanese-like domain-containing protein [Candidatus Dormibacteraceae bacterium]